jgi:hypothetical protein
MRGLEQVLHDDQRIGALVVELLEHAERLGNPARHQLFEKIEHAAAIG